MVNGSVRVYPMFTATFSIEFVVFKKNRCCELAILLLLKANIFVYINNLRKNLTFKLA